MRSIESALTRDYVRRGEVVIPLVFLGMIALLSWIFGMYAHNVVGPTTKEGVVLHVTLTQAMGFIAAVAVFQALGKITRFFVRPISAARLVSSQMALGMATIASMYAGAVGLVNLSGAGWPIVGPALFLAVALACALTAIWWFEGNVLAQFLAILAASIPLSIWFNRRYGATGLGDWQVMWQSPTAAETLTLAGISALAYALAIVGVNRIRRGDLCDFAAVQVWWDRLWSEGSAAVPFKSPQAAQIWSEWREKLGPAPAGMVAMSMLAGLGMWSFGSIPTKEVLGMMVAIPIMIMVMVMPMVYGLMIGKCSKEQALGMKDVLATRPVTNSFLARTLLRHCATALLWAWGTWLVLLAVAVGMAYISGESQEIPRAFHALSLNRWQDLLPLALVPLASWTFTALMATLSATGRSWFYMLLLCGIFGLAVLLVLTKAYVSRPMLELLATIWLVISGGVYLGGTAWAFVAAGRKGLINRGTVVPVVAAWIVATMLAALAWPQGSLPFILWLWHGAGFLSLAILPFAAMPLAVRWNRHR